MCNKFTISTFGAIVIAAVMALPVAAQPYSRNTTSGILHTQRVQDARQSRVLFTPATRSVEQLPDHVDNSTSPYFPPIINQAGGSCAQASGIAYMFTYEMNRLLDRPASLAENRFSYQFSWNLLNRGEDEGGFVEEGLLLARNYGMMLESDYGRSAAYQFLWASGYDKYYRAMCHRTENIYRFADDIDIMRRYLYDAGNGSATGGVMTFSTLSTDWKIDNDYQGPSATGYHSLLTRLGTEGGHAVTIAGYDDLVVSRDEDGNEHQGAFIVVNSWGRSSHDNGRFYLPYYFFEDKSVPSSQLSDDVNAVSVKVHKPLIVYEIMLNYSSRNDLSFQTGISSQRAETPSSFEFRPCLAFSNQGGDFPMRGQWGSGVIELAAEFPVDKVPALGSPKDVKTYAINVLRSPRGKTYGEGTVEAFSVTDYRYTPARHFVCKGAMAQTLKGGSNYFYISAEPAYWLSCSPYNYREDGSNNPAYLVRTASGRHARLVVDSYNPVSGQLRLRYKIND